MLARQFGRWSGYSGCVSNSTFPLRKNAQGGLQDEKEEEEEGEWVGGGAHTLTHIAQTHIHCMVMSSKMTSSHGGEPRDLMG